MKCCTNFGSKRKSCRISECTYCVCNFLTTVAPACRRLPPRSTMSDSIPNFGSFFGIPASDLKFCLVGGASAIALVSMTRAGIDVSFLTSLAAMGSPLTIYRSHILFLKQINK